MHRNASLFEHHPLAVRVTFLLSLPLEAIIVQSSVSFLTTTRDTPGTQYTLTIMFLATIHTCKFAIFGTASSLNTELITIRFLLSLIPLFEPRFLLVIRTTPFQTSSYPLMFRLLN